MRYCNWDHTRRKRTTACTFIAGLVLLLLSGCGRNENVPSLSPRMEEVTKGSVIVTLTIVPGQVFLDRDTLLTIAVSAPKGTRVVLPALETRFSGFTLTGTFDDEPHTADSRVVWQRNARLTPRIATEYRIAPMAIRYTEGRNETTKEKWIATPPVVLECTPTADRVADDIHVTIAPLWIRPDTRTVLMYGVYVLLFAGVIYLLFHLIRKFRRNVLLARMSPKERALRELTSLLKKRLVEKHRVKQFYLELTMIVRRYIENAHSVRAPEQTTEEFLATAGCDNRFSHAVLKKLRDFLRAADLVKFAAYHPDATQIRTAIATAEDYIESDAEQLLRETENESFTPGGREE